MRSSWRLLGFFWLGACSNYHSVQSSQPTPPGFKLMQSNMTYQTSSAVSMDAIKARAQSVNALGLNLWQHLPSARTDTNVMISTLSMELALGQVYAGVSGSTHDAMAKVLTFPTDNDAAGSELKGLSLSLEASATSKSKDATKLALTNDLWVSPEMKPSAPFLDTLKRSYNSGLKQLDFASDPLQAKACIDAEINRETNGLIPTIDLKITPNTALLLTNTAVFDANWQTQFEPALTSTDTFSPLDGTAAKVPFMHQTLHTGYSETSEYQAIALPYAGNTLAMAIVLPKSGTSSLDLSTSLTAATLDALLQNLTIPHSINVALPKFDFTFQTGSLIDAFVAMGLGSMFRNFDLTPMVGPTASTYVRIGEILQTTHLQIDELGTRAAAVTVVGAIATAWEDHDASFTVDHPALFFIYDQATHAVLFSGRLNHPIAT